MTENTTNPELTVVSNGAENVSVELASKPRFSVKQKLIAAGTALAGTLALVLLVARKGEIEELEDIEDNT